MSPSSRSRVSWRFEDQPYGGLGCAIASNLSLSQVRRPRHRLRHLRTPRTCWASRLALALRTKIVLLLSPPSLLSLCYPSFQPACSTSSLAISGSATLHALAHYVLAVAFCLAHRFLKAQRCVFPDLRGLEVRGGMSLARGAIEASARSR